MITCPICKGDKYEDACEDLVMCLNCTHLFKRTQIAEESYMFYTSSAHNKSTETHVKNAKITADYRIKFIKAFKPSGSLLEIGCGHRYFLDAATEQGYQPEGTELSLAMIDDIKDYRIHYGNPSICKHLGMYDIICGFHVLEHMNEPAVELKVLREHLNPGGIIVLEIPSMVFYNFELNVPDFYDKHHMQYFSQLPLMELFKATELTPIMQINFETGHMASTLIALSKDTSNIEPNFWHALDYMRK